VQIEISEEDHIINHEAKKGPELVLGREHELLGLVFDYRCYLGLNLTSLFQDEIGPWKLFFDAVIEVSILGRVRVSVEYMERKPARCVQLNYLEGASRW